MPISQQTSGRAEDRRLHQRHAERLRALVRGQHEGAAAGQQAELFRLTHPAGEFDVVAAHLPGHALQRRPFRPFAHDDDPRLHLPRGLDQRRQALVIAQDPTNRK